MAFREGALVRLSAAKIDSFLAGDSTIPISRVNKPPGEMTTAPTSFVIPSIKRKNPPSSGKGDLLPNHNDINRIYIVSKTSLSLTEKKGVVISIWQLA